MAIDNAEIKGGEISPDSTADERLDAHEAMLKDHHERLSAIESLSAKTGDNAPETEGKPTVRYDREEKIHGRKRH